VGFDAKVQRNLRLDFVTKQHKSLKKLQPVFLLQMLAHVNFPTFAMADPGYGGLIRDVSYVPKVNAER